MESLVSAVLQAFLSSEKRPMVIIKYVKKCAVIFTLLLDAYMNMVCLIPELNKVGTALHKPD